MKLNSKMFRLQNYFVLYDDNDYPICYFDNFNDLSRYINYSCNQLVYQFNKFGNEIKIVIGNKFYKLCTFVD